jgi:broad specificity phosphatase PhoE
MTRVILIRHGETFANAQFRLQGASDGPLTLLGEQQIELLGQHFRSFQIDYVVSSDLHRAVLTAKAIAKHHDIIVEQNPLVREWDCGVWDGRTAEVYLDMLSKLDHPISEFHPEGGETLGDVRKRAEEFLVQILTDHIGETVVVCSHGDFMRMLVGSMLNLTIDQASQFFFNNASYSLFEHDGRAWKAIFTNRIPSFDWESV